MDEGMKKWKSRGRRALPGFTWVRSQSPACLNTSGRDREVTSLFSAYTTGCRRPPPTLGTSAGGWLQCAQVPSLGWGCSLSRGSPDWAQACGHFGVEGPFPRHLQTGVHCPFSQFATSRPNVIAFPGPSLGGASRER